VFSSQQIIRFHSNVQQLRTKFKDGPFEELTPIGTVVYAVRQTIFETPCRRHIGIGELEKGSADDLRTND